MTSNAFEMKIHGPVGTIILNRPDQLIDADGNNLIDAIDTSRYTLLPNTAGCFSAEDAVRVARLGREILLGLENSGADWVKLIRTLRSERVV